MCSSFVVEFVNSQGSIVFGKLEHIDAISTKGQLTAFEVVL